MNSYENNRNNLDSYQVHSQIDIHVYYNDLHLPCHDDGYFYPTIIESVDGVARTHKLHSWYRENCAA